MSNHRPRNRHARLARVVFFDGFRAAPRGMTLATTLLVLGSVAGTCYPLGYRLLIDGTLDGSAATIASGTVVVAGLLAIAWALTGIGATEAMALADQIAVYRVSAMIETISGVPGLEHLERPDYLAEVELLNAGRWQLASAPRQVLASVSSFVRIIVALALLGSASPWLMLLPIAAVPSVLADRYARKVTKQQENAAATDQRLANSIFDLSSDVSAAGELRSYGLSPHLSAMHARLMVTLRGHARSQASRVLAVQSAGWLLYAAGLMGAIAFVTLRACDGALSLGTVLMTVSLIRRSRTQLASAASGSSALVSAMATAERLLWVEDHHAASVAAAGSGPAPARLGSGITVRGLSFTYPGTRRRVLADLSFFLPAGATIALVGQNGSGKTTLLKLLLGMYQPTTGEVLIDGQPLADITPGGWRSRCTAAFQDFSRLALPAVESVGVADLQKADSEPHAAAALDRAGAADLAAQLPSGLATYVGDPYTSGHSLSGGQWQKLALGRAMRTVSPLFVVLDEPAASLDPLAEHALFTRYAMAARSPASQDDGTITLLVSHRLSTVRMADLILYLEEGRVVELGSHEDLMAAGGRYRELFTLQAGGYSD